MQTHAHDIQARGRAGAGRSLQGCGSAQQLGSSPSRRASGAQHCLPLPPAAAPALLFPGLWPAAAGAEGLLQLQVLLGEAWSCSESCWPLLPVPVPSPKLLVQDRALSEAEVGTPLEGDEKQKAQPGAGAALYAPLSFPAQASSSRLQIQRNRRTPGLLPSIWGQDRHPPYEGL